MALHPEDAELYFELSQVYARLGERAEADQAVASFRRLRAKELQQEDAEASRAFEAGTRAPAQR